MIVREIEVKGVMTRANLPLEQLRLLLPRADHQIGQEGARP